jgi:CHAD domain-containing protein
MDDVLLLNPPADLPPPADPSQAAAPGVPPSEPEPERSAGDLFRDAFAGALASLVQALPGIRAGDRDPELVHRARVATRRMRSHLRTFRPLLERGWADELRAALRPLADALGDARDADVLSARLIERAAALPTADRDAATAVVDLLSAERVEARAHLQRVLHEPPAATLLGALADAAYRPRFVPEQSAGNDAAALVQRAWRKLRRTVRDRSRPVTDPELHRIRIAAKRVRYAAEAVTPVCGRRMETLAGCAEALQTVLGEQHDAVVAAERLRALGRDPTIAFAAGELTAMQLADADAARERWRAVFRDAARAHRKL